MAMKFRSPVVIIDEDWKSESSSGLGIRALAKAIEDQGMDVVGGFTYVDVTMVANQAARASAFVVSIDDEEIGEEGIESKAIRELKKFIDETRRRNADIRLPCSKLQTALVDSSTWPNGFPARKSSTARLTITKGSSRFTGSICGSASRSKQLTCRALMRWCLQPG